MLVPLKVNIFPPSATTALAGSVRTRLWVFLVFDGLGALLWAGLAVGLGIAFQNAVNDVIEVLEQLGKWGLLTIVAAFALIVALKWWQRQRFYRQLRMARISVGELRELLDRGESPVGRVVDVLVHSSYPAVGRVSQTTAGGGQAPALQKKSPFVRRRHHDHRHQHSSRPLAVPQARPQ